MIPLTLRWATRCIYHPCSIPRPSSCGRSMKSPLSFPPVSRKARLISPYINRSHVWMFLKQYGLSLQYACSSRSIPADVAPDRRVCWLTGSSINDSPGISSWWSSAEHIEDWLHWRAAEPYIVQAPLAIVVAMEKSPLCRVGCQPRHPVDDPDGLGEGVGSNWSASRTWRRSSRSWRFRTKWMSSRSCRFGYPGQKIGKRPQEPQAVGAGAHRERFGEPFCIKRSL